MPDWKRVIVGDAFQLPSRDFNYYRDLFLLWPFLLFTIAGLVDLFGAGHDHRAALKFVALAMASILLARERLILIGAALGFCAVQSGISFVLKQGWIALAVSISEHSLFLTTSYFEGLQAELRPVRRVSYRRSSNWVDVSGAHDTPVSLDSSVIQMLSF